MKLIKHSLQFVTELDETNSTVKTILSLPEEMQIAMLESMLKELLVPTLQPVIDLLNAGNSYAILKVVL